MGEIYFFENTKETYYSNSVGITLSNENAITKLDKSDAYNLLFVGDALGYLYIYQVDSPKDAKFMKSIDIGNQKNPITALTVYEIKNECYLFVGDMVGKVKVYDALSYNKVIEISAHFRLITSLEISNKIHRFITTSEDTFLNVWKVTTENGLQLTLAKSYNSNDKMILGGVIMD